MKKHLLLTIIFSFLAIVSICAEKEIVLKTETGDINGTLFSSETNSNSVVALIICGSGPTDRNGNNPQMQNNSIKYLAEDLSLAGISSVVYDKRGVAASAKAAKNERDLRFSTYVDDAKLWVDMLSKNYKRVVIIGHSEGALIAVLAALNNPKVTHLVSIAGVGRPADEILKAQLKIQPKQITDIAFPIIDSLKKGVLVNGVPAAFNALFRPSVQPYMISWFKIDPTVEIAKIKVPSLIIQGTTDIQVSVQDADLLAKAQPKAKKVIIQNMNHVLKECSTKDNFVQNQYYTNPSMKNIPQLSSEIVTFILGHNQ